MITDSDIARYHETGYLVVPDVIAPDLLARLRDALGALVAVTLYAGWEAYRRLLETPCRFTPTQPKVD